MEKFDDVTEESSVNHFMFRRKGIKINHYSSQEETSTSSSKGETSENQDKTPKNESESSKDETQEDVEKSEIEANKGQNFSSLVATYYNSAIDETHKRNNSRIYYLRNFNNWVKSVQIKEVGLKLKDYNQRNLKVLDMCCGKGGDLFKWAKLNARYVLCTDIAEISLEKYKTRYEEYLKKCQKNNTYTTIKCDFIPADCTRERLRSKYHDPSIQFDIVSCQFSFHYCFESLQQAECMLKNASECLKPGGFFIGTLPNAYEIVKRLKQSKKKSFGNEVYLIEMCCKEPYPLFGAKYNFYLEGVVNCPEFLVHFPTFERLARKFGLELVGKEKFTEFFERNKKTRDGEILMRKIKALELYSTRKDQKLLGYHTDYLHAATYCQMNKVEQVRTLSHSEWEVISLYLTFTFKKVSKPSSSVE